ncbi:MAG TPA: ribokinase [Arenimonas sp.]|nr:ribokinase [Arenimonas sp.]
MSQVVVVGSFNYDHAWSVDELPAPGATRLGRYASGPGGKGFNQAVASARAGADTSFITALGDDAPATLARNLAQHDGIDLRAEVHADLPSGSAGVFVDAAGRNSIVVAPGANAALSTDYIASKQLLIAAAEVVLLQLEVAPDAVLASLQAAARGDAIAVLNPAPANAETSRDLLALADVLTPNETEFTALLARHHGVTISADALSHLSDDVLHALCRRLSGATVVITLGADGAFVSHGADNHGDAAHRYRIAPETVQAIDTTGAGDAFNGALCAALAMHPETPFADAVRFANRYAALSTEKQGAALAMPTAAELQARFTA